MLLINKIKELRKHESFQYFTPYQIKVLNGLEKAIKEDREFSRNSEIMIERMWGSRHKKESV
jgi:hypothetical protein